MKTFLGIDKTPPTLKRSFETATKLRCELPTVIEMENIPLTELSSLAQDIHVKTQEATQNNDLDMLEFLGIDKGIQTIQGELINNISKLTKINKHIKKRAKS